MRETINVNDFSIRLQHKKKRKVKGSEYFLNALYLLGSLLYLQANNSF